MQLQTKTLTASVYFDGDSTSDTKQYYVQGSMPSPMNGAFLTTIPMASLTYESYSAPLSMSQFSNTATTLVFQAGTLGQHFSGTIWFDDIKIQSFLYRARDLAGEVVENRWAWPRESLRRSIRPSRGRARR